MTIRWTFVSALVVLSGLEVAAAQPRSGGGYFEKLDSDADGVVTTAEFEARELDSWTQCDANQDGKVTSEEMKAHLVVHEQESFTKRDANSNGVLERTEVQSMPDGMFKRLDTDQSGTLSAKEVGNRHQQSSPGENNGVSHDADRDGVVTKAEATAGAHELAKRIDSNGDGMLTKEELGSARLHNALAAAHARKP